MTVHQEEKDVKQDSPGIALLRYEEILARHLRGFVADFCLADAGALISHICNERHGNIEDLVTSSAELFFGDGTLCYGHGADVNFEWGKPPAVVLDMEFLGRSMTVFFKLVLHGLYVGVAIQRILLGDSSGDGTLDPESFATALAERRVAAA